MIHLAARLIDGSLLRQTVRVPTVEHAVIIKALAYGSRLEARDIEDVCRLLEVAHAYPPEEIGGWRLQAAPLRASRRDAAEHLHALVRGVRRLKADVSPARLATLVAALVARPE